MHSLIMIHYIDWRHENIVQVWYASELEMYVAATLFMRLCYPYLVALFYCSGTGLFLLIKWEITCIGLR